MKINSTELVRAHINKFWPTANKKEFVWKSGPISKSYASFSVCQISPTSEQESWVYITIGASEIHSSKNEHLEFFILSPQQDSTHIDSLAMLANYHADPSYGISLGQIIKIGHPWMDNSNCDFFLVSLPYTLGGEFEWFESQKTRIRFLWLLPITESEAEFGHKYGIDTLEDKFEKHGVEYLNPNRLAIV